MDRVRTVCNLRKFSFSDFLHQSKTLQIYLIPYIIVLLVFPVIILNSYLLLNGDEHFGIFIKLNIIIMEINELESHINMNSSHKP